MTQREHYDKFIEEWKSGDGISARTSGSTGLPKSILLTPSQIKRSASRTNEFFGIGADNHLHTAVSMEYIGGKMMIARSIVADCELSWQEPSMTPLPPASPSVDLMSVTGAQMPSVLDRVKEFKHIKNFLIGGSALSPELWKAISESGITAYESYGMTETASHIALRKISGDSPSEVPFQLLPGISVTLSSDDTLIIHDGEISVETNDVARMTESGGLHILGRRDDMIISGGRKVLPQSIEKIISENLNLEDHPFFIDSLPHPVWGNEIVMVILLNPDEKDYVGRLREALDSMDEKTLPRWQRPKKILSADTFPATGSGKLKRGDKVFLSGLKSL